jgi:uncharacterized repeat protein (TIGR03987 family)
MFFAVPCMIAALLLYSTAIWSERLQHDLQKWMVVTFAVGFSCDLIGTSIMTFQALARSTSKVDAHSCCGYAALAIMLLHLSWAYIALHKRGRAARLFHRYSIYAWMVWMLAFATGVPK